MIPQNPAPTIPNRSQRSGRVWWLLAAALLSYFSAVSFGQTTAAEDSPPIAANAETPGEPAKPQASGADNSPLDHLSPEVIYLPLSVGGPLVPIVPNASVEDYIRHKQQSREKPAEKIPPEVAKLTLTGVADDTRAILQAKFVIRNRGGAELVRLPLAMHEAVLREELPNEGPGLLQYAGRDQTESHVWWLRGQGDHVLNLEISVPVKKVGSDLRVQLTLPTATQTKLDLTTNFPAVIVKESEGDVEVINAREPTDPPARIVKYGLGQRLDLTWQPVVAESPLPAQLESDTTILADANQDRLFIEAIQRFNVVQGSVSEAIVRLPAGADLIDVKSARDYRSHRQASDDPSRVIVQLNGAKTGKFELNWNVTLKPTDLGRFVIEGFQVEQAGKQVGRIGLSPVEGLRMTVANADHPHLRQINTAKFRGLAPQVTRAYQFYNQPFRLVVGVENVEPYFTVQPRITLGVSLDELTLEAEFSLHILRGNLSSVVLDWPNWKSDEWKSDELIEEASADSPATAGRLRLRLPEDHGDRVTLRFKARRTIRPDSNIPLSLPRVIISDSADTVLVVNDAPNAGSELIPVGETVLNLVNAERFPSEKKPTAASLGKERTYRVPTAEQVFSFRVNRLEQRVSLSSSSDVSLRGSRLHVVQSLDFNVQHEPLKEFRIALPEFWRDKPVEFFLEPDRKLPAAWLNDEGGAWTARIALPEPQLGLFTILAVTDLPVMEEALAGQASVEVPILECPDYPTQSLELVTDGEHTANLVVAEPAWKPQPELSGGSRWTTEEPVSSVTIQFQPDGGSAQTFLIVGADLRANWDRKGMAQCTADYRIAGGFSRLQLVLPAEASPPIVVWDGRELRSPGEVVNESKPRHYTIRVRSSGIEPAEHRLAVRYQLPPSQAFGVCNQWSLAAPQLPQARWMAEANWRIQVPGDQHLFGYSSTVTPRFSWRRTGAFFSRVSPADAGGDGSGILPEAGENAYAFSQFGEAHELRFATMSAPLILFIGASASLLIGFLLLNFTQLQHVMTLWAGAFVIAAAGLWFRPQLEVLLQPMLVGCLFPLAAIWLQNLWKRETPPVLTFDPLMDLVESRSSVSRPSFGGDEERAEPMLVRSPSGSTHDFLQSEARSSLP